MNKHLPLRHRVGLASSLLAILLVAASGAMAGPPGLPQAGPEPAPATQPALRPLTRRAGPSDAERRRAAQLARKSLELLEQRKLDPAEKMLRQAIELDPDDSTNLYNLACVRALKNSRDEAMDYLEKSADAGFTDFYHIGQDPDLESLRDLPRFKQFLGARTHTSGKPPITPSPP